jgi:serine/threonine protein kinase/tetratricopeptide (TPR) repeat protein
MRENHQDLVGRSLSHYQVLGRLGKGGMGEVFLAEDRRLGRRTALKILPPELAAERRHLERFQREARSVAALNHPNIVTLYSVEETEGLHYLVMELIEGETLAEILSAGRLPLPRLLAIAVPLVEALEAAHSCGVIHRDLKPQNVMVRRDGQVKILDFGLARQHLGEDLAAEPETDLTRSGQIVGTTPYMSPEQIADHSLDHRSDLFSLGVMLYEMATGRRPFPVERQGKGRLAIMASILQDTPPPASGLVADLPVRFDQILDLCLAKAPSLRYASARELGRDLLSLASEASGDFQSTVHEISPPLPSSGLTTRLPARPRCYGRESEIRDLVAALRDDDPRAIPVLGPAGAGKTTLTLAALHDRQVTERFGKRRWLVRCDGVTSRDSLLGVIARSVCPDAAPPLEPRVFLELESAPAALVLDNFETPWERDTAAVEELLTQLAAVPGLALVVTLRGEERPFGPTWGATIAARPLDSEAARDTFLSLAGERFQDDPDLDPLLSALDGLPLAVVLLASQAEAEPDLSLLRQRWGQQRTELLQRAGGQERQQSLEVSLRLSLDSPRMTVESRRFLSVLGCLPEGVARQDFEALLPGEGSAAASVLRKVGLAFDQGARLRVLAPVREYLRKNHPPLPEDLGRAVEHYLTLCRLGDKIGAEAGAEAAQRLRPEAGNLEPMILAGLERPDPVPAIRAALSYAGVVRFLGLGTPTVLENARDAASIARESELEAACLSKLGDIALYRSRYEAAQRHFLEALPLYRLSDESRGEARCLVNLAYTHLFRSSFDEAIRLFSTALPLFRFEEDVAGEAETLLGLGSTALYRAEFDTALERLGMARSLFHQVGDLRGEANCLSRMGEVSSERGAHGAARYLVEEAIQLFRQAGSLQGEATCNRQLGDFALYCDSHPETARLCFESSLELYRKVGSLHGQANSLARIGGWKLSVGDYEGARHSMAEALALHQRVGDHLGAGNCFEGLGNIAAILAESTEAVSYYNRALEMFERLPHPRSIGRVHLRLACLCADDLEECRRHITEGRRAWDLIRRPLTLERLRPELGDRWIEALVSRLELQEPLGLLALAVT